MSGAEGPGEQPAMDERVQQDAPQLTLAPLPPLSRVPGWLMRMGTTAWLTLGIIALATLVYLGLSQVRSLVAPLVVAVVMGMLFYPLVDRLAKVGLRRGMAAALVLIAIALVVLGAVALSVAGVIDQAPEIAAQVQKGWEQVQKLLADSGVDVSGIQERINSLAEGAGSGLSGFVQATFSSIAFLVIGVFVGTFLLYYLLKDWHPIADWLASHTGLPLDLGKDILADATRSIRQYFYALTLTSIPVALLIGLAMWALGVPLAFTVAIVTLITSYIPYLGAIFSGAFAVLVALGAGGITQAVIVLIVVLVTQNVVQTLMLTRMASTQLSIHPIVNLASTIVGATLAGILGATLSAPVVAILISAKKRLSSYGWRSEPATDHSNGN